MTSFNVEEGKKRLAEIGERNRREAEAKRNGKSNVVTLESDAPPTAPTEPPRLVPVTLGDFLSMPIKPREMLLDPILPQKGLAMLYGTRGTGKTLVALGLAYALATGTSFLKWKAEKPRRVLLVDGEMPAAELQKRLSWHAIGNNADPGDSLKILCGDLMEIGGIGNIGDPKVQAELEPHLEEIDLVIFDNLSTLTAVIRDNDADSWNPIQEYMLRLRRRNISVLIVHHANKGGQQRGTSRREDVLDTVICLRRPSDYESIEGARFEVHIEKGRGITGNDLKPFEAKFEVRDNAAVWTTREIEDARRAEILMLHEDGMSVRKIAETMGMGKTTVHRILRSAGVEAETEKNGE
jgi:putative DNA primase/helicase